ncbi:protein tyrosine phosphatase [Pseudohyphozyma bogoriensis]|nr:protein tyrosine phosphatase [Pseudohyphozyma bogoriensis]
MNVFEHSQASSSYFVPQTPAFESGPSAAGGGFDFGTTFTGPATPSAFELKKKGTPPSGWPPASTSQLPPSPFVFGASAAMPPPSSSLPAGHHLLAARHSIPSPSSHGPQTPGIPGVPTPRFNLAFAPPATRTPDSIRGPSGTSTPLGVPSGPSPFFPTLSHNTSSSSVPQLPSSLPAGFAFSGAPPIRRHSVAPSAGTRQVQSDRYTALAPFGLLTLLKSPNSSTITIDLRTHSSWCQTRLKSSINVCVPSTLLRRPNHGIEQVSAALSPSDQAQFSKWSEAETIVVLDGDAMVLLEGSGIASMLAKFVKAGYGGKLAWVRGGFSAVRTEALSTFPGGRELLDTGAAAESSSAASGKGYPTLATPGKHGRPVLQVKDLPVSAFQMSSTSAFTHGSGGMKTGASHETEQSQGSGSTSGRPGLGKRRKSGMEGFGWKLGMGGGPEAGGGMDGGVTPAAHTDKETRVATNPFFDNIRQNSEALSLERSLSNLSPIELPTPSPELFALLPPFLASLIRLQPIERARLLARQYYDLEFAERERLEGTLKWHADLRGQDIETAEDTQGFKKYGISAGFELGTLNRFKNIFPHARVRLRKPDPSATDYINASHINLSGSRRRYIASQGPLVATFPDFWQMCEQENIGVIIMLTNLHEGGREKCGRYWVPESNYDWEVKVDGGEGVDENSGGGFFAPKESTAEDSTTVRRTINISKKRDSSVRPRKIRHIQYRAWPDFDIPAQPSDVVDLVREVNQAQKDYLAEIGWQGDTEPPILAHCSAGVGRTGVFIMVSAMLEKLARDRSEAGGSSMQADDSMEVDRGSPMPFLNSSSRTSSSSSEAKSSSFSGSPLPSPASTTSDLSISYGLRASTLGPSSSSSPLAHSFAPDATSPPSLAHLEEQVDVPLDASNPIYAGVNEMREQRMSMVATYQQFVSIFKSVLVGYAQDLGKEDSLVSA